MDGQTFLICGGLVVASAVILYVIAVFSIKEQTYEEAMAEQMKRAENEFQKMKKEKPVKPEKKYRKYSRKHKEKERLEKTPVTEAEPEEEAHIPITSETGTCVVSKVDKKEKGKKENKQGIVSSAAESLCDSGGDTMSGTDHSDEGDANKITGEIIMAEEVEEASSSAPAVKRRNRDSSVQNKKEMKAPAPPEVVEEVILKQEAPLEVKSAASVTKKKKGKQTDTQAPTDSMWFQDMLPMVRRAPLTDGEIQNLIECLLNKQSGGGGDSEWIEKGGRPDPTAQLKRQLEEKERALQNEQEASQTYQAKLRDLRLEFNQDRTRAAQSKRLLDEAVGKHQQEVQGLRARLQMTLDQSTALQTQLQQVQTKMNEEHMLTIQRLQEEKNQLQQAFAAERSSFNPAEFSRMQNELEQERGARDQYEARLTSMQQVQNDLHSKICHYEEMHKQKEAEMQKAVGELQAKLKDVDSSKCALSKELQQLQSLHGGLESENSTLKQQITSLQSSSSLADESKRKLHSKLEEMSRMQREGEERLRQMQNHVEELRKRCSEKDYENEQLRLENEGLAEVVSSEKERPAADGAEGATTKQNGSQHPEFIAEQVPEDKDSERLKEKEAAISELTESLRQEQSMVCSLHEEMRIQERDIGKVQGEINVKDLEMAKLKGQLSDYEKKLAFATQELEVQRQKNDKTRAAICEDRKQIMETLQRLFPSMTLDDKLNQSEWLSKFECEAKAVITKQPMVIEKEVEKVVEVERIVEKESAELIAKVNSQQVEAKKLRTQISHYKTVLGETEGILNKLQASVEAEEKVWQRQLTDKELEMSGLRQERDRLSKQCCELDGSMREIRAAEEAASEVCGMEFAISCIEKTLPTILGEMQDKLRELQQKLQGEENEKQSFAIKYDKAQTFCTDLQHQLDETREELQTTDKLKMEKRTVQDELEVERKTNKDLGSQTVKLNSLVKIGQDALKAEQSLNQQLQDEISLLKRSSSASPLATSNGPNHQQVEQDGGEFGAKK